MRRSTAFRAMLMYAFLCGVACAGSALEADCALDSDGVCQGPDTQVLLQGLVKIDREEVGSKGSSVTKDLDDTSVLVQERVTVTDAQALLQGRMRFEAAVASSEAAEAAGTEDSSSTNDVTLGDHLHSPETVSQEDLAPSKASLAEKLDVMVQRAAASRAQRPGSSSEKFENCRSSSSRMVLSEQVKMHKGVRRMLSSRDQESSFTALSQSVGGAESTESDEAVGHDTSKAAQTGPSTIKATHGICLDANQRNRNKGKVWMWECSGGHNQQWTYTASTKQIKATHGKCLDGYRKGNSRSGSVRMWSCNTRNANQQWTYTASVKQIRSARGLCLDSNQRNKKGGKVAMWTCNTGNANQQWGISGQAATPAATTTKACADNEAPMQSWEFSTCAQQKAKGSCNRAGKPRDQYCRKTCGSCSQAATPAATTTKATCATQKCQSGWVKKKGVDGLTSPSNSKCCEAIMCGPNQKVVKHVCTTCPPGKTSTGQHDASKPDSACDATKCGVDEKVVSHACAACPAGKVSKGSHDASGADTKCEATCHTYTCQTIEWVKKKGVDRTTSPDESTCCEATCDTYKCPPGFMPRWGVGGQTSPDKSKCCKVVPPLPGPRPTPRPTPPPTPDSTLAPTTENIVTENVAGHWGQGFCGCPDGSIYEVGDNNDECGSLACIGGISGPCKKNGPKDPKSKRKVQCGTPAGRYFPLTCPAGVLESVTAVGIKFTCCSGRDGTDCGGCAEESQPNAINRGQMQNGYNGPRCELCAGGWAKDGTGCRICADTAGWLDQQGQSCRTTPTCNNKKIRGLSSNDACCKCGQSSSLSASVSKGAILFKMGGQHTATPFSYPEVNLLLGAAVPTNPKPQPIPRTATRYTINSDCQLGEYGVQINGQTGALESLSGCSTVGACPRGQLDLEPFGPISCVLTAHEESGVNATAKVTVRGSFYGYKQSPVILIPGRTVAQPLVAPAANPAPELRCIPSSAGFWLKVNTNGDLEADLTDPSMKTMSGLSGASALGLAGALVGARCVVAATVNVRPNFPKRLKALVTVIAPQMWSEFSYGADTDCDIKEIGQMAACVTSISATIGEEALTRRVDTTDLKDMLAPTRFSMACDSSPEASNGRFSFDTLNGIGQLGGHDILTLDVGSADISLAPAHSLSVVFDSENFTTASPSLGKKRRLFVLSCRVFGHYDLNPTWNSPYSYSNSLQLVVWDDTCWIEQKLKFRKRIDMHEQNEDKCRQKCRTRPTCTHYAFFPGFCYELMGVITLGKCDTKDCTVEPQSGWAKVLGCGERSGCMSITDNQNQYISGDYCHVGERNKGGPVYLKEGETIPDTLYLTQYNQAQDPSAPAGCSQNSYIIKEANPGSDFEDPETGLMELNGNDVKCIGTRAGIDLLGEVLVEGDADAGGGVHASIAAISCGVPNITSADADNEDNQEDEGAETISPIVFDDPATTADADYWMHPCDCFSEEWGQAPPVTLESYLAVPEGTKNRFTPKPVLMVLGAFTCEYSSIRERYRRYIFDTQESLEQSNCEVICRATTWCNFYWVGDVIGSKQCRLFANCINLVRESGSEGELMALPRGSGQYCHVANPQLCWAVSGRRNFLAANLAAPQLGCAWLSLLQQCDHKLLIGGMGIKECGACSHKLQEPAPKVPLSKEMEHGTELGLSCWRERFSAVPILGQQARREETLTCVSGKWLDSDGHPGLANFGCGACLQVVKPSYDRLDSQNKQELYFATSIVSHVFVATDTLKLGLLHTGILAWQDAQRVDGWLVKHEDDLLTLEAEKRESGLSEVRNGEIKDGETTSSGERCGTTNSSLGDWDLMRGAGWSFSGEKFKKLYDERPKPDDERPKLDCAGWWGFSSGDAVGKLHTNLMGSGSGSVKFGNCGRVGVVNMYLNGKVVASASNEEPKVQPFTFTDGDSLEFRDDEGDAVIEVSEIYFWSCKSGGSPHSECLHYEANSDVATQEMAPTKIKTAPCTPAANQQQIASENLPLLLQGQAIAQGLMPTGTQSNVIPWSKGWKSMQEIKAGLKKLDVTIDCGANRIGALGAMVWNGGAYALGKVALALQCHETLVDHPADRVLKTVRTSDIMLHFPRAEAVPTTAGSNFMECAPGEAIDTVLFRTELKWKYRCAVVIAIGACHPFFTNDIDVEQGSEPPEVDIPCDRDQVMQRIELESMGSVSARYRYDCCFAGGLPISVVPQDRFDRKTFGVGEGIYCPKSRDSSGRLVFHKMRSYKEEGKALASACRDDGVWYQPLGSRSVAATAAECQSRCKSEGASYFNSFPNGGCHCARSDATEKTVTSNPTAQSGSVDCKAASSTATAKKALALLETDNIQDEFLEQEAEYAALKMSAVANSSAHNELADAMEKPLDEQEEEMAQEDLSQEEMSQEEMAQEDADSTEPTTEVKDLDEAQSRKLLSPLRHGQTDEEEHERSQADHLDHDADRTPHSATEDEDKEQMMGRLMEILGGVVEEEPEDGSTDARALQRGGHDPNDTEAGEDVLAETGNTEGIFPFLGDIVKGATDLVDRRRRTRRRRRDRRRRDRRRRNRRRRRDRRRRRSRRREIIPVWRPAVAGQHFTFEIMPGPGRCFPTSANVLCASNKFGSTSTCAGSRGPDHFHEGSEEEARNLCNNDRDCKGYTRSGRQVQLAGNAEISSVDGDNGYQCVRKGALNTGAWGRNDLVGKKITKQSSTDPSLSHHSSGRAIDGNPNPSRTGGSCTLTTKEASPWWEVNLGEPHAITSVKITAGSLVGASIGRFGVGIDPKFVSKVGSHNYQSTYHDDDDDERVGSRSGHWEASWCASNIAIPVGLTKEIACSGIGQTIRVALALSEPTGTAKTGSLSICEFGVAATKLSCGPGQYTRRRTLVVGRGDRACDVCHGETRRRRAQSCTTCPQGKVSVGWQDDCVEQKLQYSRTKAVWEITNSNPGEIVNEIQTYEDDFTIKSHAEHPLDADEGAGENLTVNALTDFDGQFEGKMGTKKKKRPKRKKPKLLTLKAVQPKYREECKDEATPGSAKYKNDKSVLNAVGLGQPAHNPCNLIAGKWETKTSQRLSHGRTITHVEHMRTGFAFRPRGGSDLSAGVDYETFNNCAQRDADRGMRGAQKAFGKMIEDHATDAAFGTGSDLCKIVPSQLVAPMGVGIDIPIASICGLAVNYAGRVFKFQKDLKYQQMSEKGALRAHLDCNTVKAGFDRAFCDLHCIRDAVKAGDKAILATMEKAVHIMGRNMDMLLDYHMGSAKDELLTAIEKDPKALLLQRANQVRDDIGSKFAEMQSLLRHSKLDASGHVTANRAFDKFVNQFAVVDLSQVNHTQLMDDIQSESAILLHTVQAASTKQLSNVGEASRRTVAVLHQWAQEVGEMHQRIGVYRSSALKQKETQSRISPTALKDAIQRSTATTLLLDFDRSWWTIREKLDLYLDAAEIHNEAFGSAMTALDDYTTKCAVDFADLSQAHAQVLQTDKAAGEQLHDTWFAVENELGLLAARLADSHGFVHLARLDVASADFATNRTAICKQDDIGQKAALLAVEHALSQGFFTQTWTQLLQVTNEMDMLRDRFSATGLRIPNNATFVQAVDRIVHAFAEGMDQRTDIASEAARRACGQDSAFSQMSASESSKRLVDLEAAMTSLRESEESKRAVEAEKDDALKQNQELHIQQEKMEEKMMQLEEKLHAREVRDLEEKVRKLEAHDATTK